MMPDDARATTRELGMSPGDLAEIKERWRPKEGLYNGTDPRFIGLPLITATMVDALYDVNALQGEVDRLRSLNAELLAVVKRTLSLFEALNLDADECARIRDLVGRAEK